MSKRFSVVQAKEVPGREKPVWLRHGVAFEKDGKISVKLETLPLPNKEGEVWLKLFDDEKKDGGDSGGGQAPWGDQRSGDTKDTEDDPLPF